ncbi:S-layer homology domain-containing protein [Calorimonas adulescens]|uniref:S-layer homology domain-containing protein n=1 Tax=Calorimonas adulescens TaxID=2606906 RepID=A0A5D8QEQ3_9THEO|nr:S-layer homology domain-containing protein [Calorimonas adulescens]TZE83200.1 S-layer homology domain-containing protein [Calorimonas adulescens]
MNRLVLTILIFLMVFQGVAYAQVPGIEGGISDGYEYQEYVFITGEPILMTGTLKITSSRGRTSYRYSLTNTEKNATLTRSYTITTVVDLDSAKHQTIETSTLDRNYSETIKVGSDTYTLDDYSLSMSRVIDNKPAVDYFAGNWTGRKIYTINRNLGKVIVDIDSKTTGYDHYWGSTETMDISQAISYSREGTDDSEKIEWNGNFHEYLSYTMEKTLDYIENDPTWISFKGGYLMQEKKDGTVVINYNLPTIKDTGDGITIDNRKRNIDSIEFTLHEPVTQERLYITDYRDISGHWAERDIERLSSLNVFPKDTVYFYPNIPITRADFVMAVSKATDMLPQTTTTTRTTRMTRNQTQEASPFDDVPVDSSYYPYIKNVYEKGLIDGISPRRFGPNEFLTRAQAVTILVRAAGLEGLAPTYGYSTGYADDDSIPSWARDSIYVATRMNILQGDSRGRVNPNDKLTRAEAAVLLNRFIDYLKEDFQRDYKDGIINYK